MLQHNYQILWCSINNKLAWTMGRKPAIFYCRIMFQSSWLWNWSGWIFPGRLFPDYFRITWEFCHCWAFHRSIILYGILCCIFINSLIMISLFSPQFHLSIEGWVRPILVDAPIKFTLHISPPFSPNLIIPKYFFKRVFFYRYIFQSIFLKSL